MQQEVKLWGECCMRANLKRLPLQILHNLLSAFCCGDDEYDDVDLVGHLLGHLVDLLLNLLVLNKGFLQILHNLHIHLVVCCENDECGGRT